MSKAKVLTAARNTVLAAVVAAPLAPGAAPAQEAKTGPTEVAHEFLRAFEKKDWATVRTLFAPNAVVSTVSLTRDGQPQVAYVTAGEWLAQIEKELAPVTSIKLELLDTSALAFEQGATVSVRFRSTGKAGEQSFTNNGIDTYSLTPAEGTWRIVRYGTFELLEFH
jgi:ketosteroid isomerase-like protein